MLRRWWWGGDEDGADTRDGVWVLTNLCCGLVAVVVVMNLVVMLGIL